MSSRIKIPLFIKKITKIDLGTLPGGTSSTAFDINSAGQIVGEGTSASGITHGFLISGANRFDLSGNPNGPYSSARGINNLGHVVGVREVINSAGKSVHHGFVRENGVMRDLGAYPPNEKDNSWSHADRINDNGLIAGCIEIFGVVWDLSGVPDFPPFPPFVLVTDKFGARPSCTYDINNSGQSVGGDFGLETAFRCQAGVYTTLEPFGSGSHDNYAHGVNKAGKAVGRGSTLPDHVQHALFWPRPNIVQDLGTLGGKESTAHDINDKGFVVGSSNTRSGARLAFIWHANLGMQSLGTLGGVNSEAFAINANGQIVGASQTASGAQHATLWEVQFTTIFTSVDDSAPTSVIPASK